MKKLKYLIEILFSLHLGIIPFIPVFKSIDTIGPQFVYLSVVELLIVVYLLVFRFNEIQKERIFSNAIAFSYLLFLSISTLSITYAFNLEEGIIELSRYFIFFIALINTIILLRLIPNSSKIIFCVLTFLAAAESIYIFNIFLENYSLETGLYRIRDLQGFSSNQNIGAFSLAIKLPLICFLFLKSKSRFIKIILLLLSMLIFFDVLVIGSRGAILATIIFMISLTLFWVLNQKRLALKLKPISILISSFLVIILVQNRLYENNQELKSINRISNYNDESVAGRKNYYIAALKGIVDSPLLGFGIGNWKILSLKYGREDINSYEVPYHAHNDLLQITAETGVFGGLFYLLIYISCLFYLFKAFRNNPQNLLPVFLVFSILIFLIDSNLNFPRARPYSQMNIIYYVALIWATFASNYKSKFNLNKVIYFFPLLLIIFSGISYKVFKSMQEQVMLYVDFNNYQSNMRTPLALVETFQEDFPTITNVCIPIKIAKAQYYLQEKDFDTAKKLLLDGKKENPYLYLTEFGLSKIYWEQNNLDSAYYYGKIASKMLPGNTSHATHFQRVLADMEAIDELDSVFKNRKDNKLEALWQNHFYLTSIIKSKNQIPFNEFEKKYSKQAIKLFPKNEIIKRSDQIINLGYDLITLANSFDEKAKEFYKNQEYESAIENWEKAAETITTDGAYHLNIAQSLISLEKYDEAKDKIAWVIESGLDKNDGKPELLEATIYLNQGKPYVACDFLNESVKKGNQLAANIRLKLDCY